jgi:hypothetical protein
VEDANGDWGYPFACVIVVLYFFSVIIVHFNRTGVRLLKRPGWKSAAIEKEC